MSSFHTTPDPREQAAAMRQHAEEVAASQRGRKSHWKRNAAIGITILAVLMTYIEMAVLNIGANAIHYTGTGRTILMVALTVFAFAVNAFVGAVFAFVGTIFVSVFGTVFGGSRH